MESDLDYADKHQTWRFGLFLLMVGINVAQLSSLKCNAQPRRKQSHHRSGGSHPTAPKRLLDVWPHALDEMTNTEPLGEAAKRHRKCCSLEVR
jgi:hypothetical protein